MSSASQGDGDMFVDKRIGGAEARDRRRAVRWSCRSAPRIFRIGQYRTEEQPVSF